MTSFVSTRDAQQGLGAEGGIGQVIVKSNADALYGFQVFCIQHIASHLKGVNLLASRERISKITKRVALVIVTDGIAKVDSIGGVRLQ